MIEMIKQATKDCKREDCALTITGTTATLVAYVPTYDRNGMMSAGGDPNTYSSRLECRTCGMKWDVHQRQQEMSVNPVQIE